MSSSVAAYRLFQTILGEVFLFSVPDTRPVKGLSVSVRLGLHRRVKEAFLALRRYLRGIALMAWANSGGTHLRLTILKLLLISRMQEGVASFHH